MNKFNYKKQIVTNQRLSEESSRDIKTLVEVCNEVDNTDSKFYLDGEEENITKILFYDEKNLIAYFGMTSSYNAGEAYIWGTIHQDYRTKNIFTELFDPVKAKCREANINILKFINERGAISLGGLVVYVGGREKYSTYKMKFKREHYKELIVESTDLTFNRASLEDLEEIVPLGMEAFGTGEEDERSYNESNLSNSKYSNFICKINNITVGIISVRIENGEGSIADLAVLKNYRGRGIGKAILLKTVTYLLNQGIEDFALSVEIENKKALSLYEDSGFRIVSIIDCYEIKI